jgi:hypothetical protein
MEKLFRIIEITSDLQKISLLRNIIPIFMILKSFSLSTRAA